MNCYVASIVGVGLLGATVSTMTVSHEQKNALEKTLSPELAEVYHGIAQERRNIYLQGLLLGLVLTALGLRLLKTSNWLHKLSVALVIIILTSVLFYTVMPKSDYMVNHLTTADQMKAWMDVYRTMKYRYYLGFLFGTLTSVPLALGFC